MSSRINLIIMACVPAFLVTSAWADGTWTFGLGAGVNSGMYRTDGTEFGAIPFLSYETERFRIGFDGIEYKVTTDPEFDFRLKVALRFEPDFPNADLFQGLDRDTALEVGFSVKRDFQKDFFGQASFLHDVSSAHNGYEAQAQVGKTYLSGFAILNASLGLRYRNDDLNAYLVGVSASEETDSRGAYSPGSTLSPIAQLSATVPLSVKSAVIGTLSYEHFGAAYDDSPLIEEVASPLQGWW